MATEFYAIGYKGWVEIRKASKPPRQNKSSVKLPYERRRFEWDDNLYAGLGGHRSKIVKTFKTIKVSVYKGGDVVTTVPTTLARSRIGITIPQGTMIHLLPDQTASLLATT